MSGGHWNYMGASLQLIGAQVADLYRLISVFEHELDWGLSYDTCIECAKQRVAAALIVHFDGNTSAAIALARDRKQNQCYNCAEEIE